jgi:hypothetical protein
MTSTIHSALEQMSTAYRALGMPVSMYGYVLEHGREYPAAPLPADIERGEMKECFANAIFCTLRHGYTYVEGFACRIEGTGMIGFAIHHGWCVDADGNVVDPTWDNPTECEYYGIEFDVDWVISLGYTGMAIETKLREQVTKQRRRTELELGWGPRTRKAHVIDSYIGDRPVTACGRTLAGLVDNRWATPDELHTEDVCARCYKKIMKGTK